MLCSYGSNSLSKNGFLGVKNKISFSSQLHNKLLETERQLGEAHGRLKEQRQLSSEKLMDKEQQVAELQIKLSRAEEEVGMICTV